MPRAVYRSRLCRIESFAIDDEDEADDGEGLPVEVKKDAASGAARMLRIGRRG